MKTKNIGILVGSLRKDSFCKKIAGNIEKMAPATLKTKQVDISKLEMFNQDLEPEGKTPQSWLDFRDELRGMDGFIFVTPEYNRSIPAVLKNALDIGSRPYGKGVWDGKPGTIISVSPGALGGFGSNQHLRQVMTSLNVYIMQAPEAYVGGVATLLDEEGNITNERTEKFLRNFVNASANWFNVGFETMKDS